MRKLTHWLAAALLILACSITVLVIIAAFYEFGALVLRPHWFSIACFAATISIMVLFSWALHFIETRGWPWKPKKLSRQMRGWR